MHRRMSLRTKLTVTVLAMFAVTMAILTWVSLSQGTRSVSQSARAEAAGLARSKASDIAGVVRERRAQAVQIGSLARGYTGADRSVVTSTLREMLADAKGLYGTWIVYLPGRAPGQDAAYAGTADGDVNGVYSPYWTREKTGITNQSSSGAEADVSGEYDEPYFTLPLERRAPVVIEPYVDPAVKRLMTSMSVPVFRDGAAVGVGGVDVSLSELAAGVSRVRVFRTGYAMLVSKGGVMMAAPDSALVGTTKFAEVKGVDRDAATTLLAASAGNRPAEVSTRDPFTGAPVHMFSVPVPEAGWTYVVVVPDGEMLAPIASLRRTLLVTVAVSIPVVALLILLVIGRLTRPLAEVRRAAARIARGDLSVDVPVRSRDEIGALAETFNGMTGYLRETAGVAERVSQGDLTATPRMRSERDALGQSLTNMITSLRDLVKQMADASQAVRRSGHEVADGAHTARVAADQMAATVSQVASGATEQSVVIEDTGRAVSGAQEAVDSAGSAADQGLARSDDTRGAMRQIAAASGDVKAAIAALDETSQKVVGITDEVEGIAAQTQLLALNASIEAARAGEHGAGFAVVAHEVADLATRAQTAAAGIRTLVDGTRAQVAHAVEIVDEGQRRTEAGADVLERAREAFGEIQQGVHVVRERIAQIQSASDVVTEVARTATATSADAASAAEAAMEATRAIDVSASQLSAEAERLAQSVERFRL